MDEEVASHRGVLVGALLLGVGVAVTLGVYGRVHQPSYSGLPSLGFSSPGAFKAWATTVVLLVAAGQLVGASWMYGRLPGAGRAPSWLATAHRSGGVVAFVISLPVAAMCLYGFGFDPDPFRARVLVHSVAGCAFYGAFAAKVVLVRSRRVPGWALPAAGGLLLTAVVLLWLTGAVWFFDVTGVHA